MRRVAEIAAVAATVGFAVAWSADAHAWCRTTTTQNDFEPTPRVACNPTGVPLAWCRQGRIFAQ